ncbi:uncharacterized protein TrAFT101_002105 [Trichoderma asperellum]|uniref:uncharacterized protein n=1 Tax=Trichoderma asperellum TaxID=101201 RepID=UPI0033219DF3|nr:hypothetical protein TrAFT101_002105 [Trichoderma asperellum]
MAGRLQHSDAPKAKDRGASGSVFSRNPKLTTAFSTSHLSRSRTPSRPTADQRCSDPVEECRAETLLHLERGIMNHRGSHTLNGRRINFPRHLLLLAMTALHARTPASSHSPEGRFAQRLGILYAPDFPGFWLPYWSRELKQRAYVRSLAAGLALPSPLGRWLELAVVRWRFGEPGKRFVTMRNQ